MKVSVYNAQKDLKISRHSVQRAVLLALEYHHVVCDEVAIHFVTNHRMCTLHQEFFDDPSPTDCITFPYKRDHSQYYFFGEIFVCPKTAFNYVAVHGGDLYKEVTLYMIHGILHLLGFDDMNNKDRKIMQAKEQELMAHLKSHLLTP